MKECNQPINIVTDETRVVEEGVGSKNLNEGCHKFCFNYPDENNNNLTTIVK